jgi:hypothetical protein
MAFQRHHASEFKKAILQAVEFAKNHGPQLMVQVYIDEEQGLCFSIQMFRDSDSILQHWKISDPNIAEVMKYCVVRKMEVYGSPSEAVRNGMASLGDGVVSFVPELTGFYRLG